MAANVFAPATISRPCSSHLACFRLPRFLSDTTLYLVHRDRRLLLPTVWSARMNVSTTVRRKRRLGRGAQQLYIASLQRKAFFRWKIRFHYKFMVLNLLPLQECWIAGKGLLVSHFQYYSVQRDAVQLEATLKSITKVRSQSKYFVEIIRQSAPSSCGDAFIKASYY